MMRIFVEAAECNSFVGVSEKLELSAPAITRAIAKLEHSLGVRLFHRTTRRVRLTDSGCQFYVDAKQILEQLEEAENAVSGVYSEPKGVLSVTAPVLFGQKHVVPIITEYLNSNPAVSVKAVFYDRIGNILDEGLDVAVRIGHLKDSSLFATHVGDIQRVVCGSPSYLKQHGIPETPAELSDHQIILSTTVEPNTNWKFDGPTGQCAVKVSPRLHCTQNGSAISAAKNGFGLTRLMSYQAGEEFKDGSLIRILRDYEPEPLPVNIVHLEGRRASAKIRSFIDLASERLRSNPFINH